MNINATPIKNLLWVLIISTTVKAQSLFNPELIYALNHYHQDTLHLIIQAKDTEKLIHYLNSSSKAKYLYSAENLVRCVIYDTTALMQMMRQNLIVRAEMSVHKKLQLLNDTMVVRNRILPVKMGVSPLPQGYDGTGVLFGLIDTGIDFSHPDFKDNNGRTRILYIWDQNVNGPMSPLPFGYGQQWDSAAINSGACTHTDLTYWGHGTHVAGIAAGNGRSTGTHQGCAPQANIIAVALDFNSSAPVIADAVQYLVNKANTINKPIAINASLGDYYGSHDATDLESQMIINLIANKPGKIMCAAAGNKGNIKYHNKITVNSLTDTLFVWLKFSSSVEEHSIYADTNQIKQVQLSVGCTNPAYHYLGNVGFKNYNYALGSGKYDTLKYNGNRIGVVYFSSYINSFGTYQMYFKIFADSLNYLWSIEAKGIGSFDAWNFDFVSSNLPTPSQFPKIQHYVMPDTVSTMVSGFQCSSEIITVGNYVNLNRYYDYNNTLQITAETAGNLAYHSSTGPTRKGIIKPEVVATGNSVFSCVPLAMRSNLISNYPNQLAPGGYHVLGGGTSAASPVVTGLAVLFLQAYPVATNQIFKSAVINCTYSDGFTGTALPNNQWGYGKLNGIGTFTCSPFFSVNEVSANTTNTTIYPNPTNGILLISDAIEEIEIMDVSGKILMQRKVNEKDERVIDISSFSNGLYLMKAKTKDESIFQKIILQK